MRHGMLMLVMMMGMSPVLADIVHLKDGTTLTGEIKRTGEGYNVTDAKGKVTSVPLDAVRSIELARNAGDANTVAASRLFSLRRSVEAINDIKTIIDRYQKFIEQNKGMPVAKDAEKDLAEWKDRLDKHMVKVGTKWVLPEDVSAMQEKALISADEARDLLKQNRLNDAAAAVAKALNEDPRNVSALYLKGLILYRQDKIPDARKTFEAVKEIAPDHGPTLNNLAVILWRQNQHAASLNAYFAAMQAMPLNKEVLNNVAEALNSAPEDVKKGVIAQKVFKLWNEQDMQLQQQMLQSGLYRWGATWVDKAMHEKLQAAEKEVKDKIAKLETEFADAQARITTIDAQITQNNDAMRWMENQRWAQDATGRLIAYPLPPQYWDYDRANRRLEVQRKESVALLDALRAKALVVKQQLPVPKYTGVQLAIGVEGTPAMGVTDKPRAVEKPAGEPVEKAPEPVVTPGVANLKDELNKPEEKTKDSGDRPLKY